VPPGWREGLAPPLPRPPVDLPAHPRTAAAGGVSALSPSAGPDRGQRCMPLRYKKTVLLETSNKEENYGLHHQITSYFYTLRYLRPVCKVEKKQSYGN